ncbi:MAG: hypothetical protein IIB56_18235 [Planctomycetes bacterium]|nr:hypothetical protein [Planctomycetota bacterium]
MPARRNLRRPASRCALTIGLIRRLLRLAISPAIISPLKQALPQIPATNRFGYDTLIRIPGGLGAYPELVLSPCVYLYR